MSLETTVLIAILTLLAICLGVSFFWIAVIQTAIGSISEPTFLQVIANIRSLAAPFMSVIFLIIFACAVTLNVIPNSRSEPYLLKIGLISLILYLVLVLVEFIFELPTIRNILLWFNLLSATVSYWSFLHYALNPKI